MAAAAAARTVVFAVGRDSDHTTFAWRWALARFLRPSDRIVLAHVVPYTVCGADGGDLVWSEVLSEAVAEGAATRGARKELVGPGAHGESASELVARLAEVEGASAIVTACRSDLATGRRREGPGSFASALLQARDLAAAVVVVRYMYFDSALEMDSVPAGHAYLHPRADVHPRTIGVVWRSAHDRACLAWARAACDPGDRLVVLAPASPEAPPDIGAPPGTIDSRVVALHHGDSSGRGAACFLTAGELVAAARDLSLDFLVAPWGHPESVAALSTAPCPMAFVAS